MSGNKALYQQAIREGHALAWELKWDSAIERYRAAALEFPDDVPALNSLAAALYKVGRLDDALAQYQKLLKITPDDDGTLVRVAEIHFRLGDAKQTTTAYLDLAAHFLKSGQKAKAIQTWVKLAELLPEELETQERLYQAISKAGESTLAGKIGLVITKLRGEQASRGLDPLAQQGGPAGKPGSVDGGTRPVDPELVAAGMAQVEEGRGHFGAGRLREALRSYACAAATFRGAGAGRELADLESAAAPLVDQFGGVRLLDLPGDEATLGAVLDTMTATRLHLQAGRLLAAMDECVAGIIAVPEYLPLQERLAEAQARHGALGSAVLTYISLAELHLLRGQSGQATAVLEKASEIGVAGKEVSDQLVSALLKVGLRDRAVRQIATMSDRLMDEGNAEEAVRQLERAIEVQPGDPALLLRWGRALEGVGDASRALGAYQQALHANRHLWEAALGLSIVAALAGDLDAVEQGLDVVMDAVGESKDYLDVALEAYAGKAAQNPACLELQLCCGVMLGRSGNWSEAAAHLQPAAKASGRLGALAAIYLGRYAVERETMEVAIRHLASVQRMISQRSPAERGKWRHVTVEFQRLWAEVCMRRGELDKAVAALGEVKRLAPHDKNAYTQLAEVYFRKGDPASAVAELLALGDLHREEQQMEGALTVYHGAMQLAPDNPAPRTKLAETYLTLGRLAEAIPVMSGLADVLANTGQVEAAVHVLREMIEHSRQSDPVRTLSLRERIARLQPDNPDARQELIAAYLAVGNSNAALTEANRLWQDMAAASRPQEAARAVQQMLQIDPWNVEALVGLGSLYEQMGERSPAIEAYRRALATDSENAEAAARLASLAASTEDTV